MKKVMTLVAIFVFAGSAVAQASVLSETNKALNKANTTIDQINTIENNVQKAKSNTSKESVKNAAKNTAKQEVKKQSASFWDKVFNRI